MMLLSGGVVLINISRTVGESGRAKKHLCNLVGAIMILYFIVVLIGVIVSHVMPQGGKSAPFFFFNILLLSLSTPLLYLVSHIIRYSKYPNKGKILLQYLSLLLPLFYLFTCRHIIFLLTLIYVVVYCVVLLVYHALWFKWHKDLWLKYNDIYRKQSVWMLWLILVPMIIHAVLYVGCLADHSPDAFYGYFIAAIVLWCAAFHRTYRYNPCPSEEKECIAEVELAEHTSTDNSVQLPPPLRLQISKALKRAEEEKLHLRPDVNLDTYAQYVGTNRTYVSRYFNQELNTTFCDYINHLRLDHAKQLLQQDGRVRISDVACQCGYIDVSTFRRNFKKYEGCSPKECRKNN